VSVTPRPDRRSTARAVCYLRGVPRAVLLAALGMLGCGRFGFNDTPDARDAGIDSPPVPGSICKVDRLSIASLPATADLAITGTAEGYAAIWVDPSGLSKARGLLLAPNHQLLSSLPMSDIKDPRLGGITDAGQKLVLFTGTAGVQTTWIVGRDLATTASQSTLTNYVTAHNPFPSDASQSPRVFVSGSDTQVSAAYIDNDGVINTASTVNRGTTGKVTDLACADGPNHAHCVYVEAISSVNGASQCTATDVQLLPVPGIPGGPIVSSDCYDVRTSSGPDVADSMIVVWSTADKRVKARCVGGGGLDMASDVAPAGSAPKVQFDGSRFWIAYLDDHAVLQLSSFDLNSRVVNYSLPGWIPLGGEAFELVRRGNETSLVLLSPAGLEFLTICT
jgi:hypothetical protein